MATSADQRRQRAVLVLLALVASCASPLETSNRFFSEFNDQLDQALLAPAANAYEDLLPRFVRTGIGNFLANLNYLVTVTNDLLQGKLRQGGRDAARLAVNTTLGIGGFFDPATRFGLEEHQEDFGQTLGVWGLGHGAYIVLPVLGPSSLRDVWRFPYFAYVSPVTWIDDPSFSTAVWIALTLDTRARLDPLIEERRRSAADPYVFTREAYLRHRRALVSDEVSAKETEEEFEGLLEELRGTSGRSP
jgi:phospholipid-binding lipoprotein MlaA